MINDAQNQSSIFQHLKQRVLFQPREDFVNPQQQYLINFASTHAKEITQTKQQIIENENEQSKLYSSQNPLSQQTTYNLIRTLNTFQDIQMCPETNIYDLYQCQGKNPNLKQNVALEYINQIEGNPFNQVQLIQQQQQNQQMKSNNLGTYTHLDEEYHEMKQINQTKVNSLQYNNKNPFTGIKQSQLNQSNLQHNDELITHNNMEELCKLFEDEQNTQIQTNFCVPKLEEQLSSENNAIKKQEHLIQQQQDNNIQQYDQYQSGSNINLQGVNKQFLQHQQVQGLEEEQQSEDTSAFKNINTNLKIDEQFPPECLPPQTPPTQPCQVYSENQDQNIAPLSKDNFSKKQQKSQINSQKKKRKSVKKCSEEEKKLKKNFFKNICFAFLQYIHTPEIKDKIQDQLKAENINTEQFFRKYNNKVVRVNNKQQFKNLFYLHKSNNRNSIENSLRQKEFLRFLGVKFVREEIVSYAQYVTKIKDFNTFLGYKNLFLEALFELPFEE